MVFEGVGSVTQRSLAPGAKVAFSDGSRAALFPKLKVMTVTAPSGQTCSLKSIEGAPYLAALCDDEKVAQQIKDHLGIHPATLAGERPETPQKDLPKIESVHLVDRYV